MFDTIIIGKGPAGITAGIYLKRANLNPVIIGKDFGALEKAEIIENYYGFLPITGVELAQKGQMQAEKLDIPVYTEEVLSVEVFDSIKIKTNLRTLEAKTLLIATGKSRMQPKIKNLENLKGKGVSFCAVCDGFFFRNKKIAILGNGQYALSEAEHLMNFSKDITLFTNGKNEPENVPEGIK